VFAEFKFCGIRGDGIFFKYKVHAFFLFMFSPPLNNLLSLYCAGGSIRHCGKEDEDRIF
jgi:hypothetical protein